MLTFATQRPETDPSFALGTPPHRHPPTLGGAHSEVRAWVEPVGAALAPGTVQGVAHCAVRAVEAEAPLLGPSTRTSKLGSPPGRGSPGPLQGEERGRQWVRSRLPRGQTLEVSSEWS